MELESHTAAPGSSDAYLDQVDAQQQESWGCKRPTEDSACGESLKRVACGKHICLKGLNLQGHLGSGAYGCVFKCTWQKRNLAIKIYHDVGQAGHDAERELMLLKHLGGSHRSAFVCHLQACGRKVDNIYCFFLRTIPLQFAIVVGGQPAAPNSNCRAPGHEYHIQFVRGHCLCAFAHGYP